MDLPRIRGEVPTAARLEDVRGWRGRAAWMGAAPGERERRRNRPG